LFIAAFGNYRANVAFDLVVRPQYAYSILRAADQALEYGISKLTIVEFGVANGAGLINMCRLAERTTKATGVQFRIVGFDTGTGLPPPTDYRDHPEQWGTGDYPMDLIKLRQRLPVNAELIIGDIAETVPAFLETLSENQPLGFAAIDVDLYTSAKAALQTLLSRPTNYLPATILYLDDIDHICTNQWAGELLAVSEFNGEMDRRKIGPYATLRSLRVFKNPQWIEHIYIAHIHDHPLRSPERPQRVEPVVIANEYI